MSAEMKVGDVKVPVPVDLGDGTKRYNISHYTFDVDQRYNVTKVVGFGAYGVVCAAVDTKDTGESKGGAKVAIKKCQKLFKDVDDGKRILREVKLLRFLNHENLLGIRTVLKPQQGKDAFRDLYIVTELFDTNLFRVITSKQRMQEDHIQFFLYQILKGLKYLHSAKVMHRDIKPENLLVNINCDLKICDFGLSRGFDEDQGELTDYVITRYYRPPELLLMCTSYTPAVDIWSVGCIFAELMNRRVLFQGKDYLQQLNLICECLGVPSDDDMAFLKQHEATKYMKSLPYAPKPLTSVVPSIAKNPTALDFLSRMLVFNPEKRLSAAELLCHPYLEGYHDPEDEPECPEKFEWEHDSTNLSEAQLRDLIWEEIEYFNSRDAL
eukprot:Sspe_Gene.38090::Locus_18371_Transcript_1_1_Confidence_1.000_Length_1310::g.38090::m.38090